MKKTFVCFVFILGLTVTGYCGQSSRIELNDGSVIEGEVISLDNGTYTLNSGSLGKIKIEASKIKRIETKSQNPTSVNNLPLLINPDLVKSGVDQVQQQITNDPEIMQIVSDLANDPQFQEAMKDPELVRATKAQDIKALMANEKFMNLIKNAKIKEIENKLQSGN